MNDKGGGDMSVVVGVGSWLDDARQQTTATRRQKDKETAPLLCRVSQASTPLAAMSQLTLHQAQAQGRVPAVSVCPHSPFLVRSRVPLPVLLEARVCRNMSRRSVHSPRHGACSHPHRRTHVGKGQQVSSAPPRSPPLTPRQIYPRKHRAAPCKDNPDERSHTPARGRPRLPPGQVRR